MSDKKILNGTLELNNSDLIIVNDLSTGGSGVARLKFKEEAAVASMQIYYDGDGQSGDANYTSIYSHKSGVGDVLVTTYGGNVGIGTASPSNGKLEIQSSTNQISVNTGTTGDGRLHIGHFSNGTFIGTYGDDGGAADLIRFGTHSGDERMRITSTGNVGIATTSPSKKLHVTGAAQVDNGGLLLGGTSSVDGNNPQLRRANSSNDLRIATAGSDRMTILGTGNVGIGTTSPAGKLEVRQAANNGNTGAFTNTHVKLTASATADNTGFVGITAATSTADNYGYSFGAQRTSGGVGDFKINYHNNSAAGVNRFTIDQDGDIILPTAGTGGAGTVTTPAGKLDIRSDSTWSNSAIIARTTTNANPVLAFYRPTGSAATSYPWWLEANGSNFHIKTGSAANIGSESVSAKVTINSSGNVGIGITNLEASAALTLHRNDVDLEFSVDYAVADTARILSYDRTANAHRDLQLRGKKLTFYTNSSEKMRLEEDGDLHVDGDVIAYSTTISDSRLKNEVKTINSAVDKVKKLRGVEYVWNKGSKEGQKDLGVIAQEVEKVLPEIVKEKKIPLITENNDKLFKTVDYEKITAVLIEAIKEQQKQIDELKNQLDAFTK